MSPPTISEARSTLKNTMPMYLSCSERLMRTVRRWNFWVSAIILPLTHRRRFLHGGLRHRPAGESVQQREPILRHGLERSGGLGQRNGQNLGAALRHHVAELALVDEIGRRHADARAEHA